MLISTITTGPVLNHVELELVHAESDERSWVIGVDLPLPQAELLLECLVNAVAHARAWQEPTLADWLG